MIHKDEVLLAIAITTPSLTALFYVIISLTLLKRKGSATYAVWHKPLVAPIIVSAVTAFLALLAVHSDSVELYIASWLALTIPLLCCEIACKALNRYYASLPILYTFSSSSATFLILAFLLVVPFKAPAIQAALLSIAVSLATATIWVRTAILMSSYRRC